MGHLQDGNLLLQCGSKRDASRGVRPQHHEGSTPVSLNCQAVDGGVDATGQSTVANDATALAQAKASVEGRQWKNLFSRQSASSVRSGPTTVVAGHRRRLYKGELRTFNAFTCVTTVAARSASESDNFIGQQAGRRAKARALRELAAALVL